MAGVVRLNPTSHDVASLLPKYDDPDPDIRYMTLVDLGSILTAGAPTLLVKDYQTCARTLDSLMKLLDDTNGDVQSQALKCIGPLASRGPSDIQAPFIEKLINIQPVKSQDTSLPATATRTLIVSFPRPIVGVPPTKAIQDAYNAVSKALIPKLLGYHVFPPQMKGLPDLPKGLLQLNSEKGVNVDAIDLMNEVIRCFGPMLRDAEIQALQKKLIEILDNARSGNVAKKKAVAGQSLLATYLTDTLLSSFVSSTIESFRSSHLTAPKRRLLITLVGSVARAIPRRFGPYMKTIAPFVFSAVSQVELEETAQDLDDEGTINVAADEVKEAALITLDDFLSSCLNDMRPFTEELIDASIRYLTYDPTMVTNSDDEMGDGEGEDEVSDDGGSFNADDEDFEEEEAMSDDEDASWKVRRCAAKLLFTLISARSSDLMDDGVLYERIAPVLVKRFNEREENVRLEILSTLALLIKKTSETVSLPTFPISNSKRSPNSRKRRREGSDAGALDGQSSAKGMVSPGQSPSPTSGPRTDLIVLGPSIINGVIRLLGQKSISTRQAAIILLREFAQIKHGVLTDYLDEIVQPVTEIIGTSHAQSGGPIVVSAGGAASATGNSLRIESLLFLGAICDTHSSKAIASYLDRIVPAVLSAINDKYFKISCEAIDASESIIKALTPPRSMGIEQSAKTHIESAFTVIIAKIRANDTDLEVRQRAIRALGICLARTSAVPRLLSLGERAGALSVLEDRLRNETTRLASIQAIDLVLASGKSEDELPAEWIESIAIELAIQFRKADRKLRLSSLETLKRLSSNPIALAALNNKTLRTIADLLLPLIDTSNLTHLSLAIDIFADIIKQAPGETVNEQLDSALCRVAVASLGGHALDSLLGLVEVIGCQGVGRSLMVGFLQNVGVTGDPAIVGSAIGTLLVSGQGTVGVTVSDIVQELQTAPDDQRKCLALSILGEVGLRTGSSSTIKPQIFSEFFKSRSEQVPRAAAIALGRASAGDVPTYLPIILSTIKTTGSSQFLLLHSIKELLMHANQARSDLLRFTGDLWDSLLKISGSEDNKAIGAECIGRLAGFEPKKYLQSLQNYLSDRTASTRGMVIQAVRFALSDTDEAFDEVLKPMLIKMLITMLSDSDLENRRLALTTLNSATRNKPNLILPHLSQLLPFVTKASEVNPDLIREVQMGPFRHKVDDGLEIRKGAYETIHALMDNAFARMNQIDLFDRVVAGLQDEHDIKMICGLMLVKLIDIDPEETVRRLDAIAEKFQSTLSTKLKDNAVKQELEKVQEASRDTLRTTVRLQHKFPGAPATSSSVQGQGWKSYLEWVHKDFSSQLQLAEQEVKSLG